MQRGRALTTFVVLLGLTGAQVASGANGQGGSWRDPCRSADGGRSALIGEVYQARHRAPVWLGRGGKTAAGRQLVSVLRAAGAEAMTACLAEALADPGGRYDRAALDVMLTDAYLELAAPTEAADADARDRAAALFPGRQRLLQRRLDALAARVADAEREQLAAGDARERLGRAVARYRLIAEQGGWPEVGPGPPIEPGDRDPRVPALRKRLAVTGDLDPGRPAHAGRRYDEALVRAVRRFQGRHGLVADGVVSGATRRALDVPARERVRQLESNVERMEAHMLERGEGPLVRVNIPEFRVRVIEDGQVTFSTRAIVGKPEHATPSLDGHITGVTLNPAWDVPRTIVREQLAARFARDAGYAERNGFHAANSNRALSEFDWRDAPMVPVRQSPGPSNALGRVKFEMPNGRAIYLHDTPQQHLFEARERAFSAGCVRVEDAMALAARLTGMARARLERMARDGETRTLRLGWHIPVQLVYFTGWVDEGGLVQFRRDIYGRDGSSVR